MSLKEESVSPLGTDVVVVMEAVFIFELLAASGTHVHLLVRVLHQMTLEASLGEEATLAVAAGVREDALVGVQVQLESSRRREHLLADWTRSAGL